MGVGAKAGDAAAEMAPGRAQTAVLFKWSDCVSGSVGTFGAVSEDYSCMLLALAIWCFRRSSTIPFAGDGDDAATKEAFHCLRRAAGILSFVVDLRKHSVSHHPGTDFDERILQAMSLQALAEASEITLERGRLKGNAPDLLAGIAADICQKFTEAEALLHPLPPVTIPVLRKYLAFKLAFYKGYSLYFQGLTLFAAESCGAAVLAFTKCRESLDAATKAAALYAKEGKSGSPVQHTLYTTLDALVRKAADKASHENGFIYHQKLPAELPALEPRAIVQAEAYVAPAPSGAWAEATFDVTRVPVRGQNAAADQAASDNAPLPSTKPVSEEQFCSVS